MQVVCAWKMMQQQQQHQQYWREKKQKELFSPFCLFLLLSHLSLFCSVRETNGSECISPPLDRVHVIAVVMQWQWPIHSPLHGNACCVSANAYALLLLSKLLYFFSFVLSFFAFFFFSSFFYYLHYKLPCMRMCVYVVAIAASARFCYWTPTQQQR